MKLSSQYPNIHVYYFPDINAGDVLNMNINRRMPLTFPKRPRRRKNATHDSFETSYLLIKDWDSIKDHNR